MEELLKIQQELNAPKNQYNSFGKYNYRSCEDILAAVKPLLKEVNCTLTLSDDVSQIANRVYVTATATLTNAEGKQVIVKASAREDEVKKGMDGAQITGSASSYARKYALNGLFCIDDVKDPDATNDHGKGEQSASKSAAQSKGNAQTSVYTGAQLQRALAELETITSEAQFSALWNKIGASTPALLMNGTEFYNKTCIKLQQLRKTEAQ